MWFAVRELFKTLHAAWQAADLPRRMANWWYVVTHQDLIGGASPGEGGIRAIRASE